METLTRGNPLTFHLAEHSLGLRQPTAARAGRDQRRIGVGVGLEHELGLRNHAEAVEHKSNHR